MKFNNEGDIELRDQKFKLVMLIEVDVVADLNETPIEIVNKVRKDFMIKKRYEGFYLDDLSLEFEVHNSENNEDLLKV